MPPSSQQIAEAIAAQIGGRQFAACTGAKLYATKRGLEIHLPSYFARSGINRVYVQLDPVDTYTVSYKRKQGEHRTEVAKSEGVYCDMLRADFEAHTGLATQLF